MCALLSAFATVRREVILNFVNELAKAAKLTEWVCDVSPHEDLALKAVLDFVPDFGAASTFVVG